MGERKIFAGARVKRLRQRLGLNQMQMASQLGVSPSYLNLIERNQRPLTVQVLLKLSGVSGVDVAELSGDSGLLDSLKEVFADPLIAGEIGSPTELADFAEAAPNAARGVARLHAAWREAQERLSELSQEISAGGRTVPEAASPPAGRAAAYFEEASPWFGELERVAEAFAARLSPRDDAAEALKAHLRGAHGVETRILPLRVMPVELARYDRHTQRLFISERVALGERPILMARQAALLGERELLDRLTAAAAFAEPEAARLCRLGFAERLAAAILAPAGPLAEAARELGADILKLSDRFTLSPSRIMARLAALGAGDVGLPFASTILVDASGAVLARLPGAGLSWPRFGPLCGRLPLFASLQPGEQVRAELVLPDGEAFVAVATAEHGAASNGLPRPRRLALIAWRRAQAEALTKNGPPPRSWPIGVTCRLCERLDCAHRIHAPVTRPAALQDYVVGPAEVV